MTKSSSSSSSSCGCADNRSRKGCYKSKRCQEKKPVVKEDIVASDINRQQVNVNVTCGNAGASDSKQKSHHHAKPCADKPKKCKSARVAPIVRDCVCPRQRFVDLRAEVLDEEVRPLPVLAPAPLFAPLDEFALINCGCCGGGCNWGCFKGDVCRGKGRKDRRRRRRPIVDVVDVDPLFPVIPIVPI